VRSAEELQEAYHDDAQKLLSGTFQQVDSLELQDENFPSIKLSDLVSR
jgi:hypothetical protein